MDQSNSPTQSEFPPVVALVGPTAVGKSALAFALAQRYDADILTADSRQVYRYMNIGTAKPSQAEQAIVRHYLLDVVAPDESYSAERFATEGERVLRRVAGQKRVALVVGGTGFYIRALLDRPEFPAVMPDLERRAAWTQRAREEGPEAIHRLLEELDQRSADRIHPRNLSRSIRALEIVMSSGEPVPYLRHREPIPALYLGLTADRAVLHERAAQRVLEQVNAGLPDETASLLAMGYESTSGPLAGFGYREMVSYLRAESTLAKAIELYTIATRQYIRRQYTWFKADERVNWLDIQGNALDQAASLIDQWLGRAASTLQ